MASLSSPTITITTHTPFLPKSPQLRSFKTRTHTLLPSSTTHNVSCKAQNNNNNNNETPWQLDRRNMLIGLGGMYGASMAAGGDALAEPLAPNMQACTLTNAEWDGSVGDICCPPTVPDKVLDFKLENYANPVMKVRRPAHLAMKDPEWLEDYKNATALMKSLPMSDPRNFLQQAMVHCAYCDGAYPVLGYPETRLEIHGSWLFAPFHRWYIYFFERIMARVINKPGFAMPYWNWDHPDGMRIPEMFKDIKSPLYDPNRNPVHLDKVIDLSFSSGSVENDFPEEKQIQENLDLMYKNMVCPSTGACFFGEEYRAGDTAESRSGGGALETSPHTNVHLWTGTKTQSRKDMGAFWSAGRDAIFYCHHANVDRMWYLWRKELPGSRKDLTDPDYLNTNFIFYDENGDPVRVYVKDSFDIEKLGYKYEEQDLPWLSKKSSSAPAKKPEVASTKVVRFPKKFDSVITTKVFRPQTFRTSDEKEEQEEILVIDFDLGMATDVIKFDVYVNDDYKHVPCEKTMVGPNYAGQCVTLDHKGKRVDMGATMPKKKNRKKVPLNKLLEEIGASDDDAIQVTIVPNSGTENIDITEVSIKFESN